MDYVLTANGLNKNYGKFKAIDELSMHIPKGAIYGLVGKNGAGKTTLIRLICGLQTPSSGEYSIYGIDSNDKNIKKSRKRMGAVVETPSVYLDMTAYENLRQQCLIMGLPSFDEIPEILKLVGLEDTGKKKGRNFSLGMKQRLGIAVALVGSPDYIVLDEPINGLDPQGIVEIRELILKLNRERQITVLISSHILDELSRLATHYGFIDKGHIVKETTAAELDAACRKCTSVVVSDTKALALALDKKGMEYEITSERNADIYGDINLSQLVHALDREDCELITACGHNESLENYFINLVGGNKDE